MAKKRFVKTKFWDDGYILTLKTDEKLVFLWAITNPLTELCGAYEAAMPTIELQTGLKPKRIIEIFEKFGADRKIHYRGGWVIVINFLEHQNGTSTNIKKGAERTLSGCPDWVKDTLSNSIDRVSNTSLPTPTPTPTPTPISKDIGGAANAANPPASEFAPPSPQRSRTAPATYPVTSAMREWATTNDLLRDLESETERFLDYHKSKGSRFTDWNAAWRNWMRNADKFNKRDGVTKNGKRQNDNKPTAMDRIRDHAELVGQYPTEAEVAQAGNG